MLDADDWAKVAAAPVQPHLGDFMIGTPAGLENTRRALAAGITTIGNLGQHFAFEPPGGYDDAAADAAITVRGARARWRRPRRARALLPRRRARDAVRATTAATSAGRRWSCTSSRSCSARGSRTPTAGWSPSRGTGRDRRPRARRPARPRLDRLDGLRQHRRHTAARPRAQPGVLSTYLLVDIAAQLHRPTGHAINPVPLTEAERIPTAAEILEVQLIARELEREARRGAPVDWAG